MNDTGEGEVIKPMYIEQFNSVDEIKECAKYYIELLGLQNWKIIFLHTDEMDEADWVGQCTSNFVKREAEIRIEKTHRKDFFKNPQELTLIHELLHCKISMPENETFENKMMYDSAHRLIDDMAKAIFNARYNLTNKDYYHEGE